VQFLLHFLRRQNRLAKIIDTIANAVCPIWYKNSRIVIFQFNQRVQVVFVITTEREAACHSSVRDLIFFKWHSYRQLVFIRSWTMRVCSFSLCSTTGKEIVTSYPIICASCRFVRSTRWMCEWRPIVSLFVLSLSSQVCRVIGTQPCSGAFESSMLVCQLFDLSTTWGRCVL
jgi:hypothetical protein